MWECEIEVLKITIIITSYDLNNFTIYLWSMAACLFYFVFLYLWDPLNWDVSDRILGVFGKLSIRRGALAWFHDVWTCGVKVFEYWMIFSLKIKLNSNWIFWRNWNVPLVLLERSWRAGFNEIYLVRFGFRMWEICIDFKVISAAESSNKFQKTRFWKGEISWGRGNTWTNDTGHTSWHNNIIVDNCR
jgi:hypothetical protein